jgi:Protein of unknown function (DUF3800)
LITSRKFSISARASNAKHLRCIVETDAHPTTSGGLRKDYGYLFERFFYYLEDRQPSEAGIIVFDELEKSKSHILVDQCHRYFRETATGRLRANLIVPEPFFVHSELTTGIQLADLVAYVVSWGFRLGKTNRSKRDELSPFVQQVARLRYLAVRKRQGNPKFEVWSFAHINDLRTREEV